VVTDKLASYIAPCARLLSGATHIRDKGANNRAENSHQPTRLRERRMRRFKSAVHVQRFLSIFGLVHDLFIQSWTPCFVGGERPVTAKPAIG